MMSRFQFRRYKAWKTALAAAGCCSVLVGAFLHRASATVATPSGPCATSGVDCGFALSDSKIQRVSPLFKLQAQISQAKIPVGDALFSNIFVNILSGSMQKCSEPFPQIRVRSGVLNLEIGRNITCGGTFLEDVVAKYNDLAFQVCIGDTNGDNCLKPIQMASVPYAIKASYANQAQNAYAAETASRSNYARRLSADSNMLNQGAIGKGYFDAQAPDMNAPGTGSSSALQGRLTSMRPGTGFVATGGFLSWAATPAANGTQDASVNICAKDATAASNLKELNNFNVHAASIKMFGNMETFGGSNFYLTSVFEQGFEIRGRSAPIAALSATPIGMVANIPVTANGNLTVDNPAATVRFGPTAAPAAGAAKTIVDMRNADVRLPDTVTAKPAITLKSIALTGGAQTASTSATFCALSLVTIVGPVGTTLPIACGLGQSSPGVWTLTSTDAKIYCYAMCF